MQSASTPEDDSPADVVYIDSIDLSANIGADWWGRVRAQPISVSVYLHLQPGYLDRAAETDDVRDSIHYGHLCKSITSLVEKPGSSFAGMHGLARAVANTAFSLTGPAAKRARVVVASSKFIPLAGRFEVEMIAPYSSSGSDSPDGSETFHISVKDLVLSTIIGVNPPEREAKQQVITHITIREKTAAARSIHHPELLIAEVAKDMETSTFLTLEKFVDEIIRSICLSSDAVHSVTVRAEKPSALSFARVAGVQLTRSRDTVLAKVTAPQ